MKRFPIIAAIITLAIIVGGVYFFSKNGTSSSQTQTPTGLEYFYGNGCPHCANVEEFLSAWDGLDKIKLEKKEVYYNSQNADLMSSRAASCGIAKSELGVPFLFTPDGKCLMGDEPIIQFLKELNL